ncbi:hypothetical protein ABZ128_20865 [Streptomyces sp. NPDC006326]|uniref:hypothetical protein n=1 Tax=Streptomyces sp. NPDC006326 TaxID=3156752 RepID=UPI0033BECE13
MGGGEHTRRGRNRRPAARRALTAVVLSVLLGALFLCLRPGEPHQADAQTARADRSAPTAPTAPARVVCVSPDRQPGCSPFSHVTPGVLPVPPPAVTVPGAAAAPVPRAADPRPGRPPAALARAPDLHALQVLRA